jgi:hypothetical protein
MGEQTEQDIRQGILTTKISGGNTTSDYIAEVTSNSELKTHDGFTDTSATEGGQKKVWVMSEQTDQLLTQMVKELKIMNMHLQYMTDLNIDKGDVEA